MKYTYNSRIGFSMVDQDKNLSLNSIVDYFQDAATFHSEDLGVGYEYLVPRNLLWVINTWQIDILKYPKYLDKITVTTTPYKFRSFLGYRNFTIEDEKGETVVKANSMWSLINYSTMKPAAVPEELPEIYGSAQPLDMEYINGKIGIPEGAVKKEPITVAEHFLDPNKHVNNGQYIKIATSYLPEGFLPTRLRTEYRNQAFLGDVLYPVVGCISDEESGDENGSLKCIWVVSLGDENGKPYAVIEITGINKK